MSEIGDVRYRYSYYRFDEDEPVKVKVDEWYVAKVTDCGVWVTPVKYEADPKYPTRRYSYWKFVLERWNFGKATPRKRWAYPDKLAAMDSFLWRKNRQLAHLERQLRDVKEAIPIAEAMERDMQMDAAKEIRTWFEPEQTP